MRFAAVSGASGIVWVCAGALGGYGEGAATGTGLRGKCPAGDGNGATPEASAGLAGGGIV